jgi:hypothetical protein
VASVVHEPELERFTQVLADIAAKSNWLSIMAGNYLAAPSNDGRKALTRATQELVDTSKLARPAVQELISMAERKLRERQDG